MASSNAAGLRCMYIWVVVRSLCPGQLSHYGQLELRAGATGHRVPEGIGAAQSFFHRSWSHSQLWGRSRMLVS